MYNENGMRWNGYQSHLQYARQNVLRGRIVVYVLMGAIGYPQLKLLRTSCHDETTCPRSLRVAEVVVYTMSRKVLPCEEEKTSRFRHRQNLWEELVQTN